MNPEAPISDSQGSLVRIRTMQCGNGQGGFGLEQPVLVSASKYALACSLLQVASRFCGRDVRLRWLQFKFSHGAILDLVREMDP